MVAFVLFGFVTVAPAQTQPAPEAVPAKSAVKKSAPKAGVKRPAAAENGPCKLGVISALGDRFSVQKFGLTVFETEESEVPIDGWGLDDLAVARVRAATGADPSVRRINYPKGSFEPFYNPKSRLLPDPKEGLPAIVRNITAHANCERYLVIVKYNEKLPGTNLVLKGIGTYNQGLGTVIRHSHLFANVAVNLIDGSTYEGINRSLAAIGAGFSEGFRIMEDPLAKLDNSLFPDPPELASSNATLRERTRALVSAKLDRLIPRYLQE